MKYNNSNVLSKPATATQTGAAIDASQIYQCSFQTVFSGVDATGTIKIQMSNDINPGGQQQAFTPTNWSDIPSASATVTAGVAGPIILATVACRWVRVIFTRTAGTGTFVVNMFVVSV